MSPRSFTTFLALAGLGVIATASIATAAPSDQSDCQAVYDTTFDPDRSCGSVQRQRKIYIPPPPPPQEPPVLKNWRDAIFDQALTSGAGSDGGSAGGNR